MRLSLALLCLLSIATPVYAVPSPRPDAVMPAIFEFSVPTPQGGVRGLYQDLRFGTLLFDSGQNPLEETGPGEVRRWLYQAAGGVLSIGRAKHAVTCIRAARFNVLSTTQEFYYELRLSALEGGCSKRAEDRPVELVFAMDDFVINRFKSGALRFFGPLTNLLLYPAELRQPERISAVVNDSGYSLQGALSEIPFVSELRVEILLRPKGQMSCHRSQFDPDRDPFSSVSVIPDAQGKWGVTVPKLGGAVCMRVVGGGWKSAVTPALLPSPG